ncbi:hypothetical protein HDU97_006275 [Phlyctochytrium planicorne]|nr:hypothetical protein HDU97_006275 [Phlyctochytrium planicorne]
MHFNSAIILTAAVSVCASSAFATNAHDSSETSPQYTTDAASEHKTSVGPAPIYKSTAVGPPPVFTSTAVGPAPVYTSTAVGPAPVYKSTAVGPPPVVTYTAVGPAPVYTSTAVGPVPTYTSEKQPELPYTTAAPQYNNNPYVRTTKESYIVNGAASNALSVMGSLAAVAVVAAIAF